MTNFELFFGNLFDRKDIATFRLLAFAHFLLAALISNNKNNENDSYIAKLTADIAAMEAGMSKQEVALAKQFSKTGTVDDVVDDFETYMHSAYVDIAFNTKSNPEAIEQFYPRGKSEYNNVSRSDAPIIMKRVSDLAETHSALIGKDLKAKLQSFVTTYATARETQLELITEVSEHRNEKNEARTPLELLLMEVMHEIARRHPGDTATAATYVRLGMLYPPEKKKKEEPAK
jgi:hypothetical protein